MQFILMFSPELHATSNPYVTKRSHNKDHNGTTYIYQAELTRAELTRGRLDWIRVVSPQIQFAP